MWAASLFSACAGSDLATQARDVRGVVKVARDRGAYRCAPRELAVAEAQVEFAERELEQGDYFRAKDHLEVAEANANEAARVSSPDRCVDRRAGPIRLARTLGDSDGDAIQDRDDLSNLSSDLAEELPEIQVTVDPNRAVAVGSTAAQIAGDVRAVLSSTTVTTVTLDDTGSAELIVRTDPEVATSVEDLGNILVGTVQKVPLPGRAPASRSRRAARLALQHSRAHTP